MLRDKVRFADVVEEFLEFARGAQWIIHNAPFDIAFLDEELKRVNLPSVADLAADVIDTLALAREHFPGKKNSLDALCERFGVANAHRTLHGAMLDAQLLAEVYLAMTRGQETLTIDIVVPMAIIDGTLTAETLAEVRVLMPSADELDLHRAYLAELQRECRGACLWVALTP
jgi:DNA polymerase-3 subunit epsilon